MKFYTPEEIKEAKDLYRDFITTHHEDALENATIYVSREFDGDNNVASFYLGIEDATGTDTGSGLDERHEGKAALETYYVKGKTMKKLKEKTQLRKLVKNSIGNTGSLDSVEFYDDYTWADMSNSTHTENCGCILRMSVGSVARRAYYGNTIDQDITAMFLKIEQALDAGKKTDIDML